MRRLLSAGAGLLVLCGGLAATASAQASCEFEIQKNCMFERVPEGAASLAADKLACEQCAQKHKADLEQHCTATAQVRNFCSGQKPVIGGYDVVAYFSLQPGEAGVLGSPEFAYNFTSPDVDGSPRFAHQFWFSSAANRDKFAADPWKYAPKNGGY